ncbi:MAG: sulfatase/phosphatase domain-containing protein, partial [Armatimonadota bacterium]
DPSTPTFPQVLQKAGYDTAFIGKWHMDNQEGVQPGFNRWVAPKGHGEYYNPTFNVDGEYVEIAGYNTDIITRYAVEWLERPRREPFCLCLAHKAPHGGFEPAVRHLKLYSDIQFKPRANVYYNREGKPDYVRNAKQFLPGSEEYDALVQRVKDYSRTLMAVDESTGRILDTLNKTGALDNTVVVFAGDNGFFFGEHGLLDKRAAYEESIRIPLLMRYPKLIRPGTLIEPMVLNIDLCPTILDLAGAETPKGVEGRSWRPLLGGRRPRTWRTEFLYEYFYDAEAKKRPPIRALRTERWKYITYPNSDIPPELYDLMNDPLEMTNLARDSSYAGVAAEMRSKLQRA